MKKDDDDFLQGLTTPDDGTANDEPIYNGLCVFARATSSAELEERERAYLESFNRPDLLDRSAAFPIVFLDDAGKAMLNRADIEQLEEIFEVTESEYRQLVEVEP